VKISDIIAGTKHRKHRSSRKHRQIQPDNLYVADPRHLNEGPGNARIQHVEDHAIWDGVSGGKKAIAKIASLAQQPTRTTIKWDGSPAVIFGRNEAGEFVLTDKAGFGAVGYDGKVTNAKDLEAMFLKRGKEAPDAKRKAFARDMRNVWDNFEAAVPEDFRGYVAGDLLYYNTPALVDGRFDFTPNTTRYSVDPNSEIGQQIAQSTTGVVLHKSIGLDGSTGPVDVSVFNPGKLLVMPPAVVTQSPKINLRGLDSLNKYLTPDIDQMLSPPAELKMTNFRDMIYTYVNNKTKAGTLDTLGQDFPEWVQANDKVSAGKKQRVIDYIMQHKKAFAKLFKFMTAIMDVKEKIIDELDQQEADIVAYTDGKRGGEGYVVDGDTKLVNRRTFTAANMNRER
jgi:hypothetical protein